ncbi:TolC family protein [Deinococcota bacterium DY0809b]
MKIWVAGALLVLGATGLAMGYAEAIERAEHRPPVESARAELTDAEVQWQRLQNDPEALRLERLQARQRLELARAQLRLEQVRSAAEIGRAYTQVLDSEAAYRLASMSRELAERSVEIARLRYVKGGISRQDLRAAELRLEDAANGLRKADEARSLARTQLASLIGPNAGPQELRPPGNPVVPPLGAVYLSLHEHPDRLRMQHAVELAETALALLDPSYASRAQIEAAELQLAKARDGLDEVVRGLELQAKQRWQEVSRLQRELELVEKRDVEAATDQKIALQRYRSGLISEIDLLRARFARVQAAFEVQTAAHAYLNAAWDLAVATAQPLEVNDAP